MDKTKRRMLKVAMATAMNTNSLLNDKVGGIPKFLKRTKLINLKQEDEDEDEAARNCN